MPCPHQSLLIWLAILVAAGLPAAAADIDMAKLDGLRSATAEAAAIEAAQARGQVTERYADGVRDDLRHDLRRFLAEPGLGPIADEVLTALDRRDVPALARSRDRLVAMEKAHGRAG